MPTLMRPFTDVREQMERMFQEMEDLSFPFQSEWKPLSLREGFPKAWLPAIDLSETEKELLIKAEIPGIEPKDIHVEVDEESVILSGETRQETKEEKKNVFRSEIRYGKFYRRIPLPAMVIPDKAIAEFKNGTLDLKLPKTLEQTRRKVQVQVK